MKKLLLSITLALGVCHADDKLKPYPAAEEGMTRHVIVLPERENEYNAKVELVVGKMTKVDAGNRHAYSGTIEKETVKGWGYSYYKATVSEKGMISTRRGTVGGPNMEDTFVTIGGEPYIVRYNSKLPLVVYVTEGFEVRYRIWTAPDETKPVPEG